MHFTEKCENKYVKDKKYHKVRDHCHYTGAYRGHIEVLWIAYVIQNIVYPKKYIAFHNGSNYDYPVIIKDLAEEFKKQFTCLGENTEKCITFTFLIEKKVIRINNNEEEVTKIYPTYYDLLIVQDLWQAHYQILLIIFLKEFIKCNVNTDTIIKNMKLAELNINTVTVFLNT